MDELLFAVPGVALANRQNPAQDPRVSIRGFGARSAFGVRGVRVLQDGVPVTLPDGQTPVDVLDLEGADRVDVVRGSASSLYGNAAGGVIDVRSALPSARRSRRMRASSAAGSTPTITATGASGTLGDVGVTAPRHARRADAAIATTPTSARRTVRCGSRSRRDVGHRRSRSRRVSPTSHAPRVPAR